MEVQQQLTSTTAPGKIFSSRSELAQHYKSDWHRYNLKRREAGLGMLKEDDFTARLEAALALKKEREGKEERSGKNHLKKSGKNSDKRDKKKENEEAALAKSKEDAMEAEETEAKEEEEEKPPKIDPKQCLFDKHTSPTIASNLSRMQRKYNFFLPDAEYLIDLEGLIGYCAEKIQLGHVCLYCQKVFRTADSCQKHMIAKRHTKIRYEDGVDMDEFDVFYDFTSADAEFLGVGEEEVRAKRKIKMEEMQQRQMEEEEEDDDDESGEWEDISDDEEDNNDDTEMKDAEDDDEEEEYDYQGYEEEIAKHGFDVTPLGELIFPDGRIIGHRGLARYYKQRIVPENKNNTAVVSAKKAAGERLYRGRVYDMYAPPTTTEGDGEESSSALAVSRAGAGGENAIFARAQGRGGNGVLVKSKQGSYTALSLYRYRAAVRKQRKGEEQGLRLQYRQKMNMNKMDKKANRLMNGVSVAHAAR
mmetsp:Transcript_24756/g.35993  ORF Transcript_24756/g.35993 Transcript_24756/m.35993 type:complete len:474 (+) Transcript_24756:143-1564(+)